MINTTLKLDGDSTLYMRDKIGLRADVAAIESKYPYVVAAPEDKSHE